MKKILFSALALVLVATGCKDDEDPICTLSSTSIVGSYKITAILVKVNAATPETDILSTIDACERDNLIVFNTGGTLNFNDVGTQCTPPSTDTGTWSLSGNSLNFDGDVFTVSEFSCTGMTATEAGATADTYTKLVLARQ